MKRFVERVGKFAFMFMMAVLALGIYSNVVAKATPVKYRSTYSIVYEAKQHIGKPYVWGATGPNSFDCSGLTQYVFGQCGISIGRTTYDQVDQGIDVPKGQEQPGDLVFFENYYEPPHVGLYIGDGKFIEAPDENLTVCISNLSGRNYVRCKRMVGVMEEFTFDYTFYADKYLDLRQAFGYDEAKLYSHWINTGIYEGRCASPMFDLKYYLTYNTDLKNAFGTNYLAGFRHFISNGNSESRKLSPILDSGYYVTHNAGLEGYSYYNGLLHFKAYGINEPRATSPSFYVVAYRNKNTDLNALYGSNYKLYYRHYVACGYNEGRVCL